MTPIISQRIALPIVLAVACLSCGHLAVAQEQSIAVLRHGVTTPLTLPEYTSQGTPYASMKDLARQLGASLRVEGAQAFFQLDGKQVALGLNDTGVDDGTASFQLGKPVLAYESDALIAMEDVVPFLRKTFSFGTPDAPPERSALSLPDDASMEDELESASVESIDTEPLLEMEAELSELESIEIRPREEAEDTPPTPAPTSLGSGDDFLLAIDPGHGGEDSGVQGPNGLQEKALCLEVAGHLSRILKEEYGIRSLLTREEDETLSAAVRQKRATKGGATLLLSIHGGASTAPAARGYQLFAHHPKQSLSMDPKPALDTAKQLAAALDSATQQSPGPVREFPLLIMRDGNLPCILVELGILTHPDDEAQLSTPGYQQQLAAALAQGIATATGRQATTRNAS